MAYCGVLDGLAEIDGKEVDFSRLEEGIIIAGDEEYDADELITDEDRLEFFNDTAIRTKDGLLKDVDELIEKIGKDEETDSIHSQVFYARYTDLVRRFRAMVEKSTFPEKLEDWWRYEYEVRESGVTLLLTHIDRFEIGRDDSIYENTDTKFEILHVRSKLLTVEQYAQAYGVTTTTVRQWIRRGKIRAAIKQGSEWRIPEIAEIMARGYQFGRYNRLDELTDLPPEYAFFNEYDYVTLDQDAKQKDLFNVCFSKHFDYLKVPKEEWDKYSRTVQMDQKEREKFELYLIGNPLVESYEARLAIRP